MKAERLLKWSRIAGGQLGTHSNALIPSCIDLLYRQIVQIEVINYVDVGHGGGYSTLECLRRCHCSDVWRACSRISEAPLRAVCQRIRSGMLVRDFLLS